MSIEINKELNLRGLMKPITVKEAAKYFRCSENLIYRLCKQGECDVFTAKRLGKRWCIYLK